MPIVFHWRIDIRHELSTSDTVNGPLGFGYEDERLDKRKSRLNHGMNVEDSEMLHVDFSNLFCSIVKNLLYI